MTALQVHPPVAALAPERRSRRRRLVAGAVAVVLLALAAWVWVARHPDIPESGTHVALDLQRANDGIADTRFVVPPGGGLFTMSVGNSGRWPFTITRPAKGEYDPVEVRGMQATDGPGDYAFDRGQPLRDVITVEPGEEVFVVLRFGVDRCTFQSVGGHMDIEQVQLPVRHLGLTTTQTLTLPLPVTIVGRSTRANHPADCPPLPDDLVG